MLKAEGVDPIGSSQAYFDCHMHMQVQSPVGVPNPLLNMNSGFRTVGLRRVYVQTETGEVLGVDLDRGLFAVHAVVVVGVWLDYCDEAHDCIG